MTVPRFRFAIAGLFALLCLAYANHFGNAFHFDDSHTIQENPWLRDLRNIPRFFMDGTTFSTLPPNRSYRPVVSASLAVDYWLSGGLRPLWFHVSTFFWFTLLCSGAFILFRNIGARARPGPDGEWAALFAAGLYALHPVEAETVNYIIQRGDLYATLGVVAGLALYAGVPAWRRFGVYLLPVAAGLLAKPPAAVFPALLWLWIWMFDEASARLATIRTLPALIFTGLLAGLTVAMNPATFVAGAASAWNYRITQPAILLGYIRKFFLPLDLTADSDRTPAASLADPVVLLGFAGLAVLLGIIWWAAQRKPLRPIAFGLGWFLIGSLPTSLVALAEVENDHRMFFPFVGLALAVVWSAMLLAQRWRVPQSARATVCCIVLVAAAWGTRERNRVWRTEESLWLDVTRKSPQNGRGLMNYALTQMGKGNYVVSLDYLNRALVLKPSYYVLEINLGVAYGGVGDSGQAEAHFRRAVDLAPGDASVRYFYARWLSQQRRNQEALGHLNVAVGFNPDYIAARHLAMSIYAAEGDSAGLAAEAQRTLARFPADPEAKSWLARGAQAAPPTAGPSAESLINASLVLFQAGKFEDCIAAARRALALRPNYPEAWNNIAAAQNSLGNWDEGIAAAERAIALRPDFQMAKNNKAWAEQRRTDTRR